MSAEDRLKAVLEATAAAVREDTLRPLTPGGGRRRRWSHVLAPIAAAAAVLLLILGVELASGGLSGTASGASPVAPVSRIGGFPTGIAVDAADNTVYVATGETNVLSVLNAATCNASGTSGCTQVGRAATGGQDPIGVAVDEQTRTVYVVNGGSDTVAVIDAATCNAAVTSGCARKPAALVKVPGGPEFLAVDPQTDTIYVADTNSGQVSVINGRTCNAADTSGCANAPATVPVGAGAFPITVDPVTNTVYVGTNSDVALIDGRTCNATVTRGCAKTLAKVAAGGDPAGIAVDQANGTIYVSSESAGTVTLVDRATCSTLSTAGCAGPHATVAVGSDPRGIAVDQATQTAYVTNASSDTVSMISTAACSAASASGCALLPPAFPVGASPRRVAVDDAAHTVYVVNVVAGTVSLVNSLTCNAADQHGCPTKPSGQTGVRGRLGGMESSCSPAVAESTSGQPAGPLTASARQVASGTVGGRPWTLWARKGAAGANGVEDGGLVIGGRWYGLCAGFPNVAEMELLNAGARGIDYGFIQQPGTFTIRLSSAGRLPSPAATHVGQLTFFIGQLPRSACSYKTMVLNAADGPAFSAEHHLEFGTCAAGRVVQITESNGTWGPGSSSSSSLSSGSGSVVNIEDKCDRQVTAISSGRPAGPLTASAARVATGTLDGQPWSLWAARGTAGVTGVENGGLVWGGRWYGLCPGAPNPSEFELLDAGAHGVLYGYVANPGQYAVTATPRGALPAPQIRRVMGGTFFIGQLAKSACSYPSVVLNATTPSVTDMHQLDFGTCRANQLVVINGGQGSW